MAVRMFKGTDDEAGTMAAVERVRDAQTKKGKQAGSARCAARRRTSQTLAWQVPPSTSRTHGPVRMTRRSPR